MILFQNYTSKTFYRLSRTTLHPFLQEHPVLTSHISSSECRPRGSKLLRTVPLKSVGSWGIILSLVLRSLRPIEQISKLSISILPPTGSTRRNSELMSVDFPLPVLPTTPILFPAGKVQVIPLRTSGVFGRYLICSEKSASYCNLLLLFPVSMIMCKGDYIYLQIL